MRISKERQARMVKMSEAKADLLGRLITHDLSDLEALLVLAQIETSITSRMVKVEHDSL